MSYSRWLTPDPGGEKVVTLADPQTWNMYSYVRDNPLTRTDPSGLCIEDACVVEGAAVIGGIMLVQATVAYLNSPQGKQAVRQTTEQLEGVIQSVVSFAKQGMGESEDEGQKTPAPKAGSAEGEGSGKRFQESVKEGEKEASDNTCRLCGTKTTEESGPKRSEIDHAIPRSRGGDNSPENAQNTCRTCNRQKGSKTTDEYLKSKGTQKSQPKLSKCEPATKTCTGATFLGAGYHN